MQRAAARGWLVLATGGSTLGDAMLIVAVPLLAASQTRDPRAISIILAMATVPWLLFGLVGGALTDRWDRRRTMFAADLTRAALLMAMTAAILAGQVHIGLLACFVFLLGCAQVLFDSALEGYVPALVGRDRTSLLRLSSQQRVARSGAEASGPGLAGVLYDWSRSVPFVVDALTFLFSAAIVRALPPVGNAAQRHRNLRLASVRDDVNEGLSFLRGSSLLLSMSLRPAVGNMGFMAASTVLVLVVQDRYGMTAAAFGWLFTAQSLGGVVGAVTSPSMARAVGTGRLLTMTAVIEGASFAVLAIATGPVPAYAAMVALGFAMGATMTVSPALRQQIVPTGLMGRVSSASRTMAMVAAPAGAAVGGLLGSTVGLTAPLWFAAALLLASSLIVARWTSESAITAALVNQDHLDAQGRGVQVRDE